MEATDRVNARLRHLPAVDRLVSEAGTGTTLARWSLLAAARRVLGEARRAALAGDAAAPHGGDELSARTRCLAEELERPHPRRVLNATGVIVHTHLGRAPLPREAAEAAASVAASYSDLEIDLETGERGSRLVRVNQLLQLVSGAEAALVVNNNAGALVLAADALAAGGEVVVSRGELVEIGGSFRLHEIMQTSRARLHEVGTTNRTHLDDYQSALGPQTALVLKVHRSNFEMRGFTAEVPVTELAPLLGARGIPLVEDRGSGTLADLRPHGIPEPPAWQGLRDGADLVLFSGDKLLGGPQAGIVLGRRDLVARMQRSPLARALRVDKMTLAALNWVLVRYLEGRALETLPVLRMLLAAPEELRSRAQEIASGLEKEGLSGVSIEAERAPVGGGALPGLELPGFAVRVPCASPSELARRLRTGDPPLLVRVSKTAVLLDPRTLETGEAREAVLALARAV